MNKDISNNKLAVLIVLSIIVLFLGFISSVGDISIVAKKITGDQLAYGTAKVNISETIEIVLLRSSINFGSGYLDDSMSIDSECNLSTYDVSKPDCWVNITMYPPVNFSHFQIENTGTVNVNLTIHSSNATDFFGENLTGGTPRYIWRGIPVSDDDGCSGGELVTEFTAFDNTEQALCTKFGASDFHDQINVSINISIPSGVIGKKEALVTFIGRKTN
jgi:hypothetical protein